MAADVVQVLVAEPSTNTSAFIFTRLLRSIESSGRSCQIWMPDRAAITEASPWRPLLETGRIRSRVHPSPALLLLNTARDWLAYHQLYQGQARSPVMQLFGGIDLRHWGHASQRHPAVRVGLGEEITAALSSQGIYREPLHTLPFGLDPSELPALPAEQSNQKVLILAKHQPALGLLIQQQLDAAGLDCQSELMPWPRDRMLQAMAVAATVVILAPPEGEASLGQRRLSAMALQAAVVSQSRSGLDALCQEGRNALVRPAEPKALTEAVRSLHGRSSTALRRRLVDGGIATALRHGSARQELEFQQLLDRLPQLWQAACDCHSVVETSA